ncbi:hypothetical protein Dda_5970 [Drechslerella dactyloides]|uniref:Uncharacterized protein n=1 Tax=Drechslerella dactyloides TaxID=74499 RepID=A0AAD6NJI0_DREDA|nr:hypothetical protein Dda_5970 [Drechslerella dactyloides]
MVTADQNSRLDSGAGQYDQIIAISEAMLNAQLETYYNIEPKLRVMKEKNVYIGTSVDAELLPPRVSIPVDRQKADRSSLFYHLRFKKAKFGYLSVPFYQYRPGGPGIAQVEVNDWEFVFKVTLEMKDVKEEQREEVKAMLRVAGDYSIQRLLLNFTMADTSNFVTELSRLKMPDGGKPPQGLIEALGGWVKGWTAAFNEIEDRLQGKTRIVDSSTGESTLIDAFCPILYHALAPNPEAVNPVAPTIPPTQVVQQTYQFVRPDQSVLKTTNRNCLLYTEMCGPNAKLPSPILFTEENGNFVTDDMPVTRRSDGGLDDTNILGTMCLDRNVLWGRHFIPYLNPIVKQTQVHLKNCEIHPDSEQRYRFSLAFGDDGVHTNSDDNYFLMQPMTGRDDQVRKEDDAGGRRLTLELKARSISQVIPKRGENKVRISGATTIAIYASEKGKGMGFATTGKWELSMEVKAVDDGRLYVDVVYPNNSPVSFTHWQGGESKLWRFDGHKAIAQMEDELRKNIEGLKDYLQHTFKNTLKEHQFILAGGGYFYMKNPVFTKKGDLLVELRYKGIPPDGKVSDYRRQQLSPQGGSGVDVPPEVNAESKIIDFNA